MPWAEQGGFLCLRGQGADRQCVRERGSHGQGRTPRRTPNSSSRARSPHAWPRSRAAQTDAHSQRAEDGPAG